MSDQNEIPPQACCQGRCEACSEQTLARAATPCDEDTTNDQLPEELGPDLGGEG